jgi:hypothetical protein
MFGRQLVLGCAHVCVRVLSCALSLSLSCVSLGFNESGACLLNQVYPRPMRIAAFSRRISSGVLEGDGGGAPVHTRAVRGDARRAGRPLQRWWVSSRTPWRCVGGRA